MRKKSFGHNKTSCLDHFIKNLRFAKIKQYIRESIVVDMGCGFNGELLIYFAPKIVKGVGFDIEVNNKKIADNITLKKNNLDKSLPLQDKFADIVVSLATIEHIKNVKNYLSEAYRILKPGGQLLITTPSEKAKPILEFLAFKIKAISTEEILDHKRYFNKSSLKDALVTAGFKRNKTKISTFELGLNLFVQARK